MVTFAVWHGAPEPLRAVGKNQAHALRFAANYPGWHSYDYRSRATVAAIRGLERRGAVVVNWQRKQFRIAYGENADESN